VRYSNFHHRLVKCLQTNGASIQDGAHAGVRLHAADAELRTTRIVTAVLGARLTIRNLCLLWLGRVIILAAAFTTVSSTASGVSIVIDASTGGVISWDRPNHLWYPASLAKLMTVYVALSEIKAGRLTLDEPMAISTTAAAISPVRFGLQAGETITIRQAMEAAIVASANDAALALAERISGSELAFAEKMNATARSLEMSQTVFRNATGLPHAEQVTTARDMAVLAQAIIRDFPEHYALFDQRSVTIAHRQRKTVNGFLGSYRQADGLKTGFTCGSGYNLVASAKHNGRRLIAVVLGSQSRAERLTAMTTLLDAAFSAKAVPSVSVNQMPITEDDLGVPPTVLRGGPCSAAAREEHIITSPLGLTGWAVVIGSFGDEAAAKQAITAFRKSSRNRSGHVAVIARTYEGATHFSAMVVNLTEASARQTCKLLRPEKTYCLVLTPESVTNPDLVWR
jgi:D-alanyl-D-alanine carboxypeptidase